MYNLFIFFFLLKFVKRLIMGGIYNCYGIFFGNLIFVFVIKWNFDIEDMENVKY